MNNKILEEMIYDKRQQSFFKIAQTNGTSFTDNNTNVKAIKEDFKKNHLNVPFDIYYAQSQNDTQILDTNGEISQYGNASGCTFAMLTNKSEGNLYLRIIEFYTFFLRQFEDIQDNKKEMDKYRTYPPLFTYTITTKLRTPSTSAGEGIESIDYFEMGTAETLNSFKVEKKSLINNEYFILQTNDYAIAFQAAIQKWNKLK